MIVFLFLTPYGGNAQTVPANTVMEVAIMPFSGSDDPSNTTQLYDAVLSEMVKREDVAPQEVSVFLYPEILELRPDEPPESRFLGASKYVLTGESYFDVENLQHFQMWLWNSETGRLVYTDELVSEDYEEAVMYMSPLVNWIFSQIPRDEPAATAEEMSETAVALAAETTAETVSETVLPKDVDVEKKRLFRGELHAGLRGGASFNTYSIIQRTGGYEGDKSQSFSYEAALLVDFRVFRFFGLQAEAVFNADIFNALKVAQNTAVVDEVNSLFLTFPLLLKVPLEFGAFNLSFYAGPYATIPLGNARIQSNVEAGTFAIKIDPPVGFILGLDIGFPLGPGKILLDGRYGRDFGITSIQNSLRLPYARDRISVSLGYKFLLWNRN
ncbi:MAG: PorT family protein [Spirochaetaceae bacterium]|nr:PorT family protein [Spirochaetaceae bacterium]